MTSEDIKHKILSLGLKGNGEEKTYFSLGRRAESDMSSVIPVGTTLVIRFTESKTRNEVTGVVLLDLGLQRLLHPPWALESVSRMGGEVSSSVFVTLGYRQLKGSTRFARPQSASVFVFITLG